MFSRISAFTRIRREGASTRWIALLAVVSIVLASGVGGMQAGDEKAAGKIDRSILDDPTRPEKEKEQDAGRKALEVYEWLGVKPGMTVADAFCSGGYNTHLLSRVVGEKGKVYAIFEFFADKEAMGGRLYKVDEVNERIEKDKLDNVETFMTTSDVPEASVDVMLAVRNYHDVEWVFDGLKRSDFLAAAYKSLKPGGVFGVIEVATPKEGWDQPTHRLNEKTVIEDFEKAGFKLAGRSDMLANPDDDHSKNGFAEGRHTMDRYLLKFEKPAKKKG